MKRPQKTAIVYFVLLFSPSLQAGLFSSEMDKALQKGDTTRIAALLATEKYKQKDLHKINQYMTKAADKFHLGGVRRIFSDFLVINMPTILGKWRTANASEKRSFCTNIWKFVSPDIVTPDVARACPHGQPSGNLTHHTPPAPAMPLGPTVPVPDPVTVSRPLAAQPVRPQISAPTPSANDDALLSHLNALLAQGNDPLKFIKELERVQDRVPLEMFVNFYYPQIAEYARQDCMRLLDTMFIKKALKEGMVEVEVLGQTLLQRAILLGDEKLTAKVQRAIMGDEAYNAMKREPEMMKYIAEMEGYDAFFPREEGYRISNIHLKKAMLKKAAIDSLPEPRLPKPATELCRKFAHEINFTDRKKPGFVPAEELFEDGTQRSAADVESLLCRFAENMQNFNSEDVRKKFKYIFSRFAASGPQAVDPDTRNTLLTEMAMANTHCSTRAQAIVNRAFSTLTTEEEPNFEDQLASILTTWRRGLITQAFVPMRNNAQGNEFGHTQMYWLQRIGYYVGVKDVAPQSNFVYMQYVAGHEHNKSIHENLRRYFSAYTPKGLINFVVDHLQNPDRYPQKERLGRFGEWLESRGKSQGDYYDEMGLQVDRKKIANLLSELGYLQGG